MPHSARAWLVNADLEQQERAQVLDEILALLRPERREVFVMLTVDVPNIDEIALQISSDFTPVAAQRFYLNHIEFGK
jgi:DNA-directed RNA polymerase specialized sigma24 family protein